jgi:hypothetical protein
LIRFQIRRIERAIGSHIDIIWSFDLGNVYPLRQFRRALLLFHPVDEPTGEESIRAARKADLIISVTNEILEKYAGQPCPRILVNHGVDEIFLMDATKGWFHSGPIRAGISGNFLRNDLDREALLTIIVRNPDVSFELWGNYSDKSNLGGGSDIETKEFINALRRFPNVIMHGAVDTATLAAGFSRMDLFLICYDVQKDQSKGTNYHKIMEYLGSGKAIVSNNVTAYKDKADLVYMVESRDGNQELPALFEKVKSDLNRYNDPQLQQLRIEFARRNTYPRKVDEIDEILQTILADDRKGR